MEFEVSQKVRAAIKAKLLELGMHVDEELPDYVMVLIANRRSKFQMDQDLNLFMGDNTSIFTTWLHDVLKKLEAVTSNLSLNANKKEGSSSTSKDSSSKVKEKDKSTAIGKKKEKTEKAVSSTKKRKSDMESEEKTKKKRIDIKRKSLKDKPSKTKKSESTKESFSKTEEEETSTSSQKNKTPTISNTITMPASTGDKVAFKFKSQNKLGKSMLVEDEESTPKSLLPPLESKKSKPRSESRSPIRSKSISPVKSKSPVKARSPIKSKSPVKVRSPIKIKSPVRTRTKSPIRINRSPIRKRSPLRIKSPVRKRSPLRIKSPLLRSRSPPRNKSPTYRSSRNSTLSRSPIRFRSRSKSKSPIRYRSLSKSSNRHRSPKRSRISRSRSRSRSKSRNSKPKKEVKVKSLIGAIVKHLEPSRSTSSSNSVASVVHVTDRPKREIKSQPNKKLLFRAMEDAQKSVVSRTFKTSRSVEKEQSDHEEHKDKEESVSKQEKELDLENEESELSKKRPVRERLGLRCFDEHSFYKSEQYLRYPELQPDPFMKSINDELTIPMRVPIQSIRVNVPTSREQQRNVTLEPANNSKITKPNSPKRISIQVNVNDDESTSEESDSDREPEDMIEDKRQSSDDDNIKITADSSDDLEKNFGSNKKEIKEEEMEEVYEEIEYEVDCSDNENDDKMVEYVEMSDDEEADFIKASSKIKNERAKSKNEDSRAMSDDDEYEVSIMKETNDKLPDPDDIDNNMNEKSSSNSRDQKEQSESPEKINVIVRRTNDSKIKVIPSRLMSNGPSQHPSTQFRVTIDNEDEMNEEQNSYNRMEDNFAESMDLRQKIKGIYSGDQMLPILTRTVNNEPPQTFYTPTLTPVNTTAPSTSTSGGAGGGCKFWPNCTFKDKCIYPHPACKFGYNCKNQDCAYKHEGSGSFKPVVETKTAPADDGKILCKFFPKCHSLSCPFFHPSPCRFGLGCTDLKCKNHHPGKTLAETRKQNSLFGSFGSRPSNKFSKYHPPSHLLKWVNPEAKPATTQT